MTRMPTLLILSCFLSMAFAQKVEKTSLRRLLAKDCGRDPDRCNMSKECSDEGFGCMYIQEGDGHCRAHHECRDLLCGYENCQEFDPNEPSNKNCCFDPNKEGYTVVFGSDTQYYSEHCMFGGSDQDMSYILYDQNDCTNQRENSDRHYTMYMDTLNHFAHTKGNVAGVAFIGDMLENGKDKWINRFEKKNPWGKHFYPSLGNHDVWNPVVEYPRTEPEWASNMYWYQYEKMEDIKDDLHHYDLDSFSYSYVLGHTLYVNLQFHPAFVGLTFQGEDPDGFDKTIELKSPYEFFVDLLDNLPADSIFGTLRSIVLIYHVPNNSASESYVDFTRWIDVVDKMKTWNNAYPETPILAAMTGHLHHKNGYFPYDILERSFGDRPVRRFINGSRDYMAFLSLKMFDYHSNFDDRYYEVWSHAQDPVTREWTSLCVHERGKTFAPNGTNGKKCTKFYFNNALVEVDQPASYF